MGTVLLTLPDELIHDAEKAGLLGSEAIEKILRDQLRAKAFDDLVEAMDKMHALDDPPPITPEEIAEEVRAMRAERRAQASTCA